MMNPNEMSRIFDETKTIAVVGMSRKPHRAGFYVPEYLQRAGYRIIPVNPNIDEALGEQAYPSLEDVPGPIDLINVFRRSRYVSPLVVPTLESDTQAFWTQLGVRDNRAAAAIVDAGILVVQDRCLMQEHMRLMLEGPPATKA